MSTHLCPAPGCTKVLPLDMAAYLPARQAAVAAVAAQIGPAS